jgi:phage tail sheath protein FI
MPIQPTYPGVYVQEVSSGVRTITGVSTSIAAFFGRTAKGPISKAVRCLSYSDFLRNFGGAHPLNDLGASVNQFFANGGTDCYVVRLAKGASAASVTLRNGAGGTTKNVLTATAKGEGGWGQDIKLLVDYNTANPDDSFNLTVTQETGNVVVKTEVFNNLSMNPRSPRFAPPFVTQSSKLIELKLHADMGDPNNSGSYMNLAANTKAAYSQSRRVLTAASDPALFTLVKTTTLHALIAAGKSKFIVNMNGIDAPVDLNGVEARADWAAAADLAGLATALTGHINSQLALTDPSLTVDVVFNTLATRAVVLRLTSTATPFSNVTIRRADSGDISGDLMLGTENGGIETGRYSNLRPIPNGAYFSGSDMWAALTDIDKFSVLTQADVTSVTIGSQLTNVNMISTVGTESMYQQAGGGADGVREKLNRVVQAINNDVNSPATAELWGYHLVYKLKTGTLNSATTAASAPAAGAILGSGVVPNVRQYSLGALGTGAYQSAGTPGSDGIAPGQAEYEGDPILHTGFYALDKVDLFNLMVLPADREYDVANVKGSASIYCVSRRAFLLLDAPDNWTQDDHPTADAATVNTYRIGVSKQHSAIFYPRVEYSDGGIRKLIGPSGMIAGLMARIDSQRGVWKAPAGIEADLRGLTDLEINMTDNENGVLNKLGVNCIRKFPNGVVSWGARTLDGSDDFGSEWKYIPIRRLALFLEESLFRGTKWVVFEPNDEPLWAKIRMNLNAFMMSLYRQGAFQGSTPDKAFFVKCDGETTTANDRNLGIVNIQVGFAPLKPAEFVIISIQQIPDV